MNLMDWSSTNILAIGLGTVVYLWSASSGKVTHLHDLANDNDDICSVAWSRSGTYLSVGTRRGTVQVWDTSRSTRLRVLNGHWGRVGAVRWGPHIMASGSRDCTIRLTDVRVGDALIQELRGHRAEVCGLEVGAHEQSAALDWAASENVKRIANRDVLRKAKRVDLGPSFLDSITIVYRGEFLDCI
ncbi:unnamed protein product [Ostreobium quekettii]|uniref:Anaphase-promoting complex subunit 4 WD40 domain-containing protein n=1 Tax=Ostreobium quekettii TaxID=121088 RepID=A0A8S1JFX9_9CHLO|nr:unnamed protein product [Ostreobium quekettii]